MNFDSLKTGDIILSNFNSLLGYAIRVVTTSEYNHIYPVIRIDPSYLPKIKIIKEGGLLCVLENKNGKFEYNGKKYVYILRTLPKYKSYKFASRSLLQNPDDFIHKTSNYIKSNAIEFLNKEDLSYISEIVDSDRDDIPYSTRENALNSVCSELTLSYYEYILGIKGEDRIYSPEDFVNSFPEQFGNLNLIDEKSSLFQTYPIIPILLIILFIVILIVVIYKVYTRWRYYR